MKKNDNHKYYTNFHFQQQVSSFHLVYPISNKLIESPELSIDQCQIGFLFDSNIRKCIGKIVSYNYSQSIIFLYVNSE